MKDIKCSIKQLNNFVFLLRYLKYILTLYILSHLADNMYTIVYMYVCGILLYYI